MAEEEDPWGFDESEQSTNLSVEESAITVAIVNTSKYEAIDTKKEIVIDVQPDALQEAELNIKTLSHVLEDDGYRKPVQLYRHWVRPKFLQYKYMYNYRTNYYDDVIDYLDKKLVGVPREIPRPQTWAERVLRSNYCNNKEIDSFCASRKQDKHLIQTLAASIRAYNYHTKAYINQKYAHVL